MGASARGRYPSMFQARRSNSDYTSRFPVAEAEFVQLGRGEFDLSSQEVWGDRSFILRVRSKPEAIWTVVADPGWMAFALPLSWCDEYRVNGWNAKLGDVFLMDGRTEFSTSAADRDALLIGVRRDTLIQTCAALLGGDSADICCGHRLLEIDGASRSRLHLIVERAFVAAKIQSSGRGELRLRPVHEKELICSVADLLVSRPPFDEPVRLDQRDPFRIVRLAKEITRTSSPDQFNLAHLCAAAGVGKSRLHQCFVDVHGISPGQYLLKQRLSAARDCLRDPINPPETVKDAALRFGFTSSGRFSKTYSAIFEELPSETLERTRNLAGLQAHPLQT